MELEKLSTILSLLFIFGTCWAQKSVKEICESPRSSIDIPGDATIIGVFDSSMGLNCSTTVTRGIHQMLSAVWVVQKLNELNFIPGVKLGIRLYDTCSASDAAQKTVVKALVERECYNDYSLGILTTPTISSHIRDLISTLHVPVPMTNTENGFQYPLVAVNLTVTLLKNLNWTYVTIAIASSTQVVTTFGQVAAKHGICIRQQMVIPQIKNRTWSHLLQTSELQETGQLAVVLGSTREIRGVIQSAQLSNATSTIQWVFVPLDISQEFFTMESLPVHSLIVAPPATVIKEIEDNMEALEKIFHLSLRTNSSIYITKNHNITIVSSITRSPFFSEVASPLLKLYHKLKIGLVRYCEPTVKTSRLCSNLPLFLQLTSLVVSDKLRNSESGLTVSDISNHSGKIHFYKVQRVKSDSQFLLETIGEFHETNSNKITLELFSHHINLSGMLNSEMYDENKHCRHEENNTTCKSVCVNMGKDEDRAKYKQNSISIGNGRILTFLPIIWREEAWVAAVASIAAVGFACSLAIFVFILVRICKGDVLEGNPSFSFLLLLSIDCTYFSILPFSLTAEELYPRSLICGLRIFGTTTSYSLLFSIMLSRSFMLASCDQEGGFMSHVNGYLQTVLCFFIAGVQFALSVQFWAINSTLLGSRQCSSIYEGHLFLLLLSYDMFLLLLLVCTSPFIARSKRNYREGMFFTVASFLCLLIFIAWSTAYLMVPAHWQDAAITGGLTATATVILVTVFIPRTYLMMTGIVRDHLASALPSLAYTSTTSIQDVNYRSNPVLYDTVAPLPLAQPQQSTGQVNLNFYSDQPQSPVDTGPETSAPKPNSERGFGERRNLPPENTYERYDTPPSPQKVTRF